MWQDEEPGSMTPYLSLCQHFFNSVLIKCNNLGEIWAINRTLCDPCKWVTEGQTGDEQGGQLTCCLRYPFSFLNIFISRFKLRINFSLGSYNISQINQKDVTDMKQNPVEVETMEWRNKYMLNTLIKTIQVKWNWSHQLRFLSDLKFIYSKFYIFFMFLKVSFWTWFSTSYTYHFDNGFCFNFLGSTGIAQSVDSLMNMMGRWGNTGNLYKTEHWYISCKLLLLYLW